MSFIDIPKAPIMSTPRRRSGPKGARWTDDERNKLWRLRNEQSNLTWDAFYATFGHEFPGRSQGGLNQEFVNINNKRAKTAHWTPPERVTTLRLGKRLSEVAFDTSVPRLSKVRRIADTDDDETSDDDGDIPFYCEPASNIQPPQYLPRLSVARPNKEPTEQDPQQDTIRDIKTEINTGSGGWVRDKPAEDASQVSSTSMSLGSSLETTQAEQIATERYRASSATPPPTLQYSERLWRECMQPEEFTSEDQTSSNDVFETRTQSNVEANVIQSDLGRQYLAAGEDGRVECCTPPPEPKHDQTIKGAAPSTEPRKSDEALLDISDLPKGSLPLDQLTSIQYAHVASQFLARSIRAQIQDERPNDDVVRSVQELESQLQVQSRAHREEIERLEKSGAQQLHAMQKQIDEMKQQQTEFFQSFQNVSNTASRFC